VLSEQADFIYKATDYYSASAERCLLWNDPALAIDWPLEALGDLSPTLTQKDVSGTLLIDADIFLE
jgi:dTDP-4-dehydrorhamnose 3,5-epimerase